MKPIRATPGWLTVIAVAAVAAVNVAGLWGIFVARQGGAPPRRAGGSTSTSARAATSLERRLSEIRSDLAFLGGSPTIARLDEAERDKAGGPLAAPGRGECSPPLPAQPRGGRAHRRALRPTTARSSTSAGAAASRCCGSRRARRAARARPSTRRRPRLTARLPHGEEARPLAGGVTIETEVEPAVLLDQGATGRRGGPPLRAARRGRDGGGPPPARAAAPRRPRRARGRGHVHRPRRRVVAAGAVHARAARSRRARSPASPSRCGRATARPTA